MEEHGRQFEADQLRYVSWAQSTKRRPELLSASAAKRPTTGFEEDARGYIRRTETSTPDVADTGSDLLLQETLTRRGLSADAMTLMTYPEKGELIVERLMEEIRAEAMTPQHARVSLAQLQRADEYIWTRLAELAPACGGIRPRPDGSRPLDGLVEKVRPASFKRWHFKRPIAASGGKLFRRVFSTRPARSAFGRCGRSGRGVLGRWASAGCRGPLRC